MIEIQLTIHGRQCGFNDVSPHTRLLDFLRERGLTRAKEGCAEGECGACAVLVARPDGTDRTRWTSINACLPPAVAFDGQEVVTEVTGEEHAADHERALDHRVPLLDEDYTGYRQSVRRPDEIIRAIRSGASPAVWPMMRGRQRSRRTW